MRSLVKYMDRNFGLSPIDDILNRFLKEIDSDFSKLYGGAFFTKTAYPKFNMVSYNDKYIIEATVPGLDREDIEIEIEDSDYTGYKVLWIKGQKASEETEDKEGTVVHREIRKSAFTRGVYFDSSKVDFINLKAKLDKGILTVELPRLNGDTKENSKVKIDIE